MKKQRILSLIAAAVLSLSLAGCGQQNSGAASAAGTSKPKESEVTEMQNNSAVTSKVFMTADISPEGLMSVYNALERTPDGKVAVKLSTGEPPNSNYLRPELIADLVKAVDGNYR